MLDDDSICGAIEYDLIGRGLRLRWLGTEILNWRDLKVIVQHSDRTSALFRAHYPDDEMWGLPEHLMARAVEALEWLRWAKTKDARSGRNRPDPIWRPGLPKPEAEETIGNEAIDTDAMDAWLGWSPN